MDSKEERDAAVSAGGDVPSPGTEAGSPPPDLVLPATGPGAAVEETLLIPALETGAVLAAEATAALVAMAATSIVQRITLLPPPGARPDGEPVHVPLPSIPVEAASLGGGPSQSVLSVEAIPENVPCLAVLDGLAEPASDTVTSLVVPTSAEMLAPAAGTLPPPATDAALEPVQLAQPVSSVASSAEPAAEAASLERRLVQPIEPTAPFRLESPSEALRAIRPGDVNVPQVAEPLPEPAAIPPRVVRIEDIAAQAASRQYSVLASPNAPLTFDSTPAPVADEPVAPADGPRWRRLAIKGLRIVAIGVAGYLAFVLVLIGLYRFVDPPGSNLMAIRWLAGNEIEQTWVPLDQISPNLVRAVIASEDDRFCVHWGVDPGAIKEAIERAADGLPRGASTISMQVTKNMFLWPSKSFVRKAIELPLTLIMELWWPKSRVLEMYLNVAEWGPGIFGAEAAARHHFQKPAERLSEREAALLAASLPNPIRRDAGDPGPRTSQKASIIQARMRASREQAACILSGDGQRAK